MVSETTPTGTFENRLTPLLASGDLSGAWELLESLDEDDLREARAWFRKDRRAVDDRGLAFAGDTPDEAFDTRAMANWIQALCVVTLGSPAEAAKRVRWPRLLDFRDSDGEAVFVHQLWDADPAWVAEFVTATSALPTGRLRLGWETLGRVVRAAVIHHGLPCPSGRAFIGVWEAVTPGDTVLEKLRGNPMMPELLFQVLASQSSGASLELPPAIAELVRSGELDREAVLEQVLGLLTAPRRPTSQRTLTLITEALELRPDEVPGGLTYLLGVIATSHGSAGKILLPHAIALVQSEDDLAELASVVASRSEKKQREMLLSALGSAELQGRVGHAAIRAAAALLADTEDTAMSGRANKLIERLGGQVAEPEPPAGPTGLWDLNPDPPDLTRSAWSKGWPVVLDGRVLIVGEVTAKDLSLQAAWTLQLMSLGRFNAASMLINPAIELLGQSR